MSEPIQPQRDASQSPAATESQPQARSRGPRRSTSNGRTLPQQLVRKLRRAWQRRGNAKSLWKQLSAWRPSRWPGLAALRSKTSDAANVALPFPLRAVLHARVRGPLGACARAARQHAYLVLLAIAALVFARALDFSAPSEVRNATTTVAALVGDVPTQTFSRTASHPNAVQLRATLRRYPDSSLMVSKSEPEMDALGHVLSQPVVTTIFGMNATVEQSIRLEAGDLEVQIQVDATPRLLEAKNGKDQPIELETEILVKSQRFGWWQREPVRRVHLDSSSFLTHVPQQGHRTVFSVDDHLFSLDLELHVPGVASDLE